MVLLVLSLLLGTLPLAGTLPRMLMLAGVLVMGALSFWGAISGLRAAYRGARESARERAAREPPARERSARYSQRAMTPAKTPASTSSAMIPSPAGSRRWDRSIGPGLTMSKTRNSASAASLTASGRVLDQSHRDQGAGHLVDHDRGRVLVAAVLGYALRRPDAEDVSATVVAQYGPGPSSLSPKCSGSVPIEPTVPGATLDFPQPNQVAKTWALLDFGDDMRAKRYHAWDAAREVTP